MRFEVLKSALAEKKFVEEIALQKLQDESNGVELSRVFSFFGAVFRDFHEVWVLKSALADRKLAEEIALNKSQDEAKGVS